MYTNPQRQRGRPEGEAASWVWVNRASDFTGLGSEIQPRR